MKYSSHSKMRKLFPICLLGLITFGMSWPAVTPRWHADSDHYNGLPDLLDRFADRRRPGPARLRRAGQPRREGRCSTRSEAGESRSSRSPRGIGSTSAAGRPWPRSTLGDEIRPGSTDNARSVVLEVASSGRRLLLTGDLERDGLADLVARRVEPLDAMLAPHHGGRTSNPAWLYDWAKPALVVVSQRPLAAGSRDPLEPLAEGAFPPAPDLAKRRDPAPLVPRRPGRDRLPRPAARHRPVRLAPCQPLGRRPSPRSSAWRSGPRLCLALTVVEWGAWSLVMPGRRLLLKEADRPASPSRPPPPTGPDWPAPGSRPSRAEAGPSCCSTAWPRTDPPCWAGSRRCRRRGWDVAVLDARAAGESGGRRSSFGARESADLLAWLDALTPLAGPTPTFAAWGRSMGASTALRAAASDPRIAALILEAPYKALQPAVAAVLRRLRIPFPNFFATPDPAPSPISRRYPPRRPSPDRPRPRSSTPRP